MPPRGHGGQRPRRNHVACYYIRCHCLIWYSSHTRREIVLKSNHPGDPLLASEWIAIAGNAKGQKSVLHQTFPAVVGMSQQYEIRHKLLIIR